MALSPTTPPASPLSTAMEPFTLPPSGGADFLTILHGEGSNPKDAMIEALTDKIKEFSQLIMEAQKAHQEDSLEKNASIKAFGIINEKLQNDNEKLRGQLQELFLFHQTQMEELSERFKQLSEQANTANKTISETCDNIDQRQEQQSICQQASICYSALRRPDLLSNDRIAQFSQGLQAHKAKLDPKYQNRVGLQSLSVFWLETSADAKTIKEKSQNVASQAEEGSVKAKSMLEDFQKLKEKFAAEESA